MTTSQLPSLLFSEGYISLLQREQSEAIDIKASNESINRNHSGINSDNHQQLIQKLLNDSAMDSIELRDLIAKRFNYPIVELVNIEAHQLIRLPQLTELCITHLAIPLQVAAASITIATVDPTNPDLEQEFHFATQQNIHLAVCSLDDLSQHYTNIGSEQSITPSDDKETHQVNDAQARHYSQASSALDHSPISQYILQVLNEAYQQGSSDIHFEPYQKRYRIRYRCDGILREITAPPQSIALRLTSRLKIMANLDIAQQRFPQDGRIELTLSDTHSAEYRVSTLPTLWGEKVVLRSIQSHNVHDLATLGMSDKQYRELRHTLECPQGMVLITGPTGSGKTQTLYAALRVLNQSHRNISTAEDPIEMQLDGINQVQLHPAIGLTYHQALRAFLRQDPDVMMVGEIRDTETAKTAIKAAQTGHLLLSTLHTNSAHETITRLLNLGIEPYNLAASLNLIIAQRLIRLLCAQCKIPQAVTEQLQQSLSRYKLDSLTLFKASPQGCKHCHQGYKGRVAVFELLTISKSIKNALLHPTEAASLDTLIEKQCQPNLYHSGIEVLLKGHTSLAELKRVLNDSETFVS